MPLESEDYSELQVLSVIQKEAVSEPLDYYSDYASRTKQDMSGTTFTVYAVDDVDKLQTEYGETGADYLFRILNADLDTSNVATGRMVMPFTATHLDQAADFYILVKAALSSTAIIKTLFKVEIAYQEKN